MNILIIGSGAREHAIARALQRSPQQSNIFCCAASNNPGLLPLCKNYWIGNICDANKVIQQATEWQIELVIIGPEAPLEAGMADELWQQKIPVIGPTKKLAQVETSKAFTRDLMQQYKISGAPRYQVFENLSGVNEFLQQLGEGNYVIKANGLMGGKGVKVAGDHLHSIAEAIFYCEELLIDSQSIVIEEKLIGEEFSLMCFCDGETLIPMPAIQDHKRAYVDDKGPNTGGMGCYSDANHSLPFLSANDIQQACQINKDFIKALSEKFSEKYIGILYGSFIATKKGVYLIEYNARFGDPEAMSALAVLSSDFINLCQAMVQGSLAQEKVTFKNLATVCKYSVPDGYPDDPIKNSVINVADVQHPEQLYYGAVDIKKDELIATGSRAVAVVGIGATLAEAEKIAEAEIQRIQGSLFHRSDIGTAELINRRIMHMKTLRQEI